MNISNADQQLVDAHLRNEMTPDLRRQWEQRMADADFAKYVAEMRATQIALVRSGRKDLKSIFASWDNHGTLVRRLPVKYILGIAAGVAILILCYVFIPTSTGPDPGTTSLASAYMEPYPNVIAPLQKSSGTATKFDQAFHLYESGHYGKALLALEDLNPNDEGVQFYEALSHLFLGSDVEAKAKLNNIISNPDHRFYQPALWYLALAQINLDEQVEARTTLRHVVTGQTPFSQRASDLMQQLK